MFPVILQAPGRPGQPVTDWQMTRESAYWFGASVSGTTEVVEAPDVGASMGGSTYAVDAGSLPRDVVTSDDSTSPSALLPVWLQLEPSECACETVPRGRERTTAIVLAALAWAAWKRCRTVVGAVR